jgi:hypothetical protein
MSTLTAAAREARAIKVAATAQAKNEAMLEEIQFLLGCGEGKHAITRALGYAGRPEALKRQLNRLGKNKLIPSIFEWDASIYDRKASK